AQPATAMGLLLEAARAFVSTDPTRARDALLEAVDAGFVSEQFTFSAWHSVADLALATSPREPSARTLTDGLLDAAPFVSIADYASAMPLLREAAERLAGDPLRGDDLVSKFSFGLFVANELWDDRGYERWARVVEAFAREQGALIALQYALLACAALETRAGRFAAAEAYYDDTVEITRAVGGFPEFYALLKVD